MFLFIESFLESAEVPEVPFLFNAEDEMESYTFRPPQQTHTPLPGRPCSLAEELEKEEQKNSTGQLLNGNHYNENEIRTRNKNSIEEEEGLEETRPRNEGDDWFEEDEIYYEEMMGVDPLMRTEVEMLQKEKETWDSDQKLLEKEKKELREEKDAFER